MAQTSLFIPGFDAQPVSANIIGVGSDARTTWELKPGVTSGSFDDSGFVGTGQCVTRMTMPAVQFRANQLTIATLIAGPNDVKVILDDPSGLSLNENCGINGNIADCTVVAVAEGSTTTVTVQETISAFEIQPGSAATSGATKSTAAPSSGASASGSGTSQAGSTPSGGASQTSAPVPTNTQGNNNAGVKLGASSFFLISGGLTALLWL